MLLIRRGWNHSLLVWIWTRDDQCHTSRSLEAQSQAPASFAGKEWGCHHPRAEYSSQPETCENTWAHEPCTGSTWVQVGHSGGVSGRQSTQSTNTSLPHPVSPLVCIYTCFGKGNGWKWLLGAWHELSLWASSWQLGKHPCSMWASGCGANTASWPLCLLHSAQVRLWGLRDCKILEIKFLMECQLFLHSYATLKFILALAWYGCNAMRRYNVQQCNENVQCPTIFFLICFTYTAVSLMAEQAEKQKPEGKQIHYLKN